MKRPAPDTKPDTNEARAVLTDLARLLGRAAAREWVKAQAPEQTVPLNPVPRASQ